LKYEERLKTKREESKIAYEKFSSDIAVIESDLDKKMKEKFQRMKTSAQEFLNSQKEGIDMMAEVSRGVYEVLEKLAAEEINKDPLAFIRRESFLKGGPTQARNFQGPSSQRASVRENGMKKADDIDEDKFKDAYDDEDYYKNAKKPQDELYNADLLKELEEKYHEANVNIMKRTTVQLNTPFEEEKIGMQVGMTGQHPFIFEPRKQLPFFKDPELKISIWTVLKDSIGKDLSKITMPVYFN
jgi:hypothetical protein